MARVSNLFRSIVAPNAVQDASWQLWVLGLMYLMLGGVIVREAVLASRRVGGFLPPGLARLFRGKDSPPPPATAGPTFRGMFFVTSSCLMFVRAYTFLFPIGLEMFWLIFTTKYLTYFLQYATYSLVIVFLAKVLLIMQGSERGVTHRLYPIYGASLAFLWAAAVLSAVFVTEHWRPHVQGYGRYVSFYASFIYLLLAILQGVYGSRTYRMLSSITISHLRRRRVTRFMVVASVFFMVFVYGFFYNLTYFLGLNPVHDNIVVWHQSHLSRYWDYLLIVHTTSEIVPVSVLLLTFRILVPTKKRRAGDASRRESSNAAERLLGYR